MTDTPRTVGLRGRLPVLPPEKRFALKWADEYLKAALPAPSYPIDVSEAITDFGMMGNDQWGDCVEAGEVHYEMTTAKAAGTAGPPSTSPLAVQRAQQFAGFVNPPGPGTNMPTYLHKLFQAGIIKAWAPINPANQPACAAFMQAGFGLLIGVELYDDNEQQFGERQPFDADGQPDPSEGHCVLWVGSESASGPHTFVTWGALQQATQAWLTGACLNNPNGEVYLVVTTEEQAALFEPALLSDVAALDGEGGIPNPVPSPPPNPTPVPTPTLTLAEYAAQARASLEQALGVMQAARRALNEANTSPTLTPAQHKILATVDGPLRVEDTGLLQFLQVPIPGAAEEEPEAEPDEHWYRSMGDIAHPPQNPHGN